jgi:glycosyltransferase 2 family protein
MTHHVKKLFVMALKVGLSAAIIGYLVYDAMHRGDVFTNLRDQPKHWDILAAAWAACLVGTLLTFVRWWYLVCALGVPCRLADALRISFWGYLFNLAPLGIVGGDLVRAVMLGHEYPQHRAKALGSVLVDRVVGLYLLFLVASSAILLTGFWRIPLPDIQRICKLTFILTIVGTVGLAFVMGPEVILGPVVRACGRIPRVGGAIESLIRAVRMYRHMPLVMFVSSLMSIGVHCSFAIGLYLIACGLPGNHLSLADHFVVIPVSNVAGVLPLPMGPFEAVLDYLYMHVPVTGPAIAAGQGLVVALIYRLITLLIAAMGAPYYFGNRGEMAEVIHEAEEDDT